jgi:hypothetical protein
VRFGAVLKVLVPATIIVAAVFIFFGILDGAKWLGDLRAPERVKVTGQVFFNGEPLADALIVTRPVKPGLRGAIGPADEQGRFNLLTEFEGSFLEGACVGEHQVTVKRYYNVTAMGEPPLMTPRKYASFETSPLRIMVKAEGENSVELRLEGKPGAPPANLGAPSRMRPPGGRPPGTGEGGPRSGRDSNGRPAREEETAPAKATPPTENDNPAGGIDPVEESSAGEGNASSR